MATELNKLDEKLIELSKTLFKIKSHLDIYKIISLNAQDINSIGRGKTFFGHVQQMCLDSYILDICKIFEEEKRRHEINSLSSILKTAKRCVPKNKQPLIDFVNEHRDLLCQRKEASDSCLVLDVENIHETFRHENLIKDDRFQKVRDKIIAHSESIQDAARPKDVQSYDMMERILFFAIDLHAAVNKAYLNVHPHPSKNDKKAFSSTRTVLEKFGVSNIKTTFDDE